LGWIFFENFAVRLFFLLRPGVFFAAVLLRFLPVLAVTIGGSDEPPDNSTQMPLLQPNVRSRSANRRSAAVLL
jgi:hypothetical protein